MPPLATWLQKIPQPVQLVRSISSHSRIWIVALGFATLLVSLTAMALWQLRIEAETSQERELALLSSAINDELDRGLQGIEEALRAISGEVATGRLTGSTEEIRSLLKNRVELIPVVTALWLLDAGGVVRVGSDTQEPPAESSFQPLLSARRFAGLSVSPPFGVESAAGPQIGLALPIYGDNGRYQGAIVASVPSKYLLGAFSAASTQSDVRMAVFRADGTKLAGQIADGPALTSAERVVRLASRPKMEWRRVRDGSERLVSLNTLSKYQMTVMITRDREAVLRPWRLLVGFGTAGVVLLLLTGGVLLRILEQAEKRHLKSREALQTKLARSSKLEALGTLAGGISHDFNNILASIIGFGEMAQGAAVPGSPQDRHLGKVLNAALRGRTLIERILVFSSGGATMQHVFELAPVIDEVLELLAGRLKPGIILEQDIQSGSMRIKGDPAQAFEAIMNLCTNAIQAMPEGGMLSIGLQRLTLIHARHLSHSKIALGNYFKLVVSDQGHGVPADVLEHLFEPFFTTRRAESGTGLGLAVVHGIMGEFRGGIDVETKVGQGTTFSLYFPEAVENASPIETATDIISSGKGQHVLVLDDEPDLAEVMSEHLKVLGYVPHAFTEPHKAMLEILARPERYAAIVSDEMMPGLSGTQLVQALRARDINVPCLLVSGYGGALLAARATRAGVEFLLTKPVRRADLAKAMIQLGGG